MFFSTVTGCRMSVFSIRMPWKLHVSSSYCKRVRTLHICPVLFTHCVVELPVTNGLLYVCRPLLEWSLLSDVVQTDVCVLRACGHVCVPQWTQSRKMLAKTWSGKVYFFSHWQTFTGWQNRQQKQRLKVWKTLEETHRCAYIHRETNQTRWTTLYRL